MATKKQILGVLAGASAPMARDKIGEAVGENYRKFQTQLDRWEKAELIKDEGEHKYILTDKGREEAAEEEMEEEIPDTPADGDRDEDKEPTQATVGTTEYQQFMKLGKNIGVVPTALIKVTTDHIWQGGDYQDLKWVATGLQQMGIMRDLANRWLYSWASHLKISIPIDLPKDFKDPEARKAAEAQDTEKKAGSGKRDYILDEDDVPQFVGEGLGSMDYQDALALAKIRAARGKPAAVAAGPSSLTEVIEAFKSFRELQGEKATGKSFIMKPGENGQYQVEEVDMTKPMVMPAAPAPPQTPSYFVDGSGEVQEIVPGKPIVIVKGSNGQPVQAQKTILIDKATGTQQEVAAGMPIIIYQDRPVAQSQSPMIAMKDKDGKDVVFDIETYFRMEDHKAKKERDAESHEAKMEIVKGFKDLLSKAGNALGNMNEED